MYMYKNGRQQLNMIHACGCKLVDISLFISADYMKTLCLCVTKLCAFLEKLIIMDENDPLSE